MPTKVTYNGVTLYNVLTQQCEQRTEYDQTNADRIATRYHFVFRGFIHAPESARIGNVNEYTLSASPHYITHQDDFAGDLKLLHEEVRRKLLAPRKELKVILHRTQEWGGVNDGQIIVNDIDKEDVLLASTRYDDAEGGVRGDVDNGPRPLSLNIVKIVGTKALQVEFEIETMVVDCESPGEGQNFVLSNRWGVDEEMDDNFFTTRRITGRMRVSAPIPLAHVAKGLIVPPLESGFKRDRIEFRVDPSGLNADWQVTDKQVQTAAPWPATKINGHYRESSIAEGRFFAEVFVHLEGHPAASKKLMLFQAVKIIETKLHVGFWSGGQPSWRWLGGEITDYFGENHVIEAHGRIERFPGNLKEHMWLANLFVDNIGTPLKLPPLAGASYNPKQSHAPPTYGYEPGSGIRSASAVLLTLHCALHTVCDTGEASMAIGENEEGDVTKYATTQGEVIGSAMQVPTLPALTAPPPLVDDEHRAAIYEFGRIESDYIHDPLRVQLPIARSSAASDGDNTCIVAQLSTGKVCRRVIRYDAQRVGACPRMPEPLDEYTDGDLTGVLLHHWERYLPPQLSADPSQTIYRLQAEYIYGMNRTPRPDEATRIGINPITSFTQDQTAITRENLYHERLAP